MVVVLCGNRRVFYVCVCVLEMVVLDEWRLVVVVVIDLGNNGNGNSFSRLLVV